MISELNSIALVEERLPGFITYLKGRGKQNLLYQNQLSSRRNLEVGDHVLLPIPRVDRSNTCPKNLEAEVLETLDKDFVRLGTETGKIDTAFRQEQLTKVTGKKRKFEIPEHEIKLTRAYRADTSYNSQNICKCNQGCSSRRCRCFKSGLKCSSKCHNGNSDNCDNPK